MKQFKEQLKQIACQLKGITLQLVTDNKTTPFESLKAFGYAVLDQEELGNTMKVSRVWTAKGSVAVDGFDELNQLLQQNIVTGVSFMSYREYTEFTEYLRSEFGTNN